MGCFRGPAAACDSPLPTRGEHPPGAGTKTLTRCGPPGRQRAPARPQHCHSGRIRRARPAQEHVPFYVNGGAPGSAAHIRRATSGIAFWFRMRHRGRLVTSKHSTRTTHTHKSHIFACHFSLVHIHPFMQRREMSRVCAGSEHTNL